MTKRPETIDVFVWNADEQVWDDGPDEELVATYRDTYPNPGGYHQYGAERSNGEYLEIRIPLGTD